MSDEHEGQTFGEFDSTVRQDVSRLDSNVKPEAAHVLDEIEKWWKDEIHGSPASQHTPTYSYMRKAMDRLKSRLAELWR